MALTSVLDAPAAGFNFENVSRNAAFSGLFKGGEAPKPMKTGTTIAAVVFKDGVVLGADTRATSGKWWLTRCAPNPLHRSKHLLLWSWNSSRHRKDHRSSLLQPHHLLPEQWEEPSCHHGRQHPAGYAVQVSRSDWC
ncbi:hypothetical protein Q5P01_018691 [Channa striata]|uniref:Uncharacterized protein n=1 Tax=Channa striata TaxID=64152 RepID=A0AA88M5D5_CHASR|nr:hypothetical protein Q5P01_018691 [Channa striata]